MESSADGSMSDCFVVNCSTRTESRPDDAAILEERRCLKTEFFFASPMGHRAEI